MNKQDTIQRFVFENQAIRGEIVYLTEAYHAVVAQPHYPPIIKKLLGESVVAAVLLAATIKFKGTLTIQFHGDGPIKMLVVKCDNAFNIRGMAKFDENANAFQLEQGFGSGKLVITIMQDNATKNYQSIIPIHGSTISQCLENYFSQSEQLLTKIYLNVTPDHASGILLQLMPSTQLEQREQFMLHAVSLSPAFIAVEWLCLNNEIILQKLFPHECLRLFDSESVRFKCTCSLEKMRAAVKTFGKEETENIFLTSKTLEVCCEYCNHTYAFDKSEVSDIFH